MLYDIKNKYGANWVIGENNVTADGEYPAKYESVMCQGNGYMCIRAAAEEKCSPNPGAFTIVAGTFDTADGDDCNTLVNMPDTVHFAVSIDGTEVSFENAKEVTYLRTLDLKS